MIFFYLLLFLYQQKTIDAFVPLVTEKNKPNSRPLSKWQEKMLSRQRDLEMGRVDEDGNVLHTRKEGITINELHNKQYNFTNKEGREGTFSDQYYDSPEWPQSYPNWNKRNFTKWQRPEPTRFTKMYSRQQDRNSRRHSKWQKIMISRQYENDTGRVDEVRNVSRNEDDDCMNEAIPVGLESKPYRRGFDSFQWRPTEAPDVPFKPWLWKPFWSGNRVIYYYTDPYLTRDYSVDFFWPPPVNHERPGPLNGQAVIVKQIFDIMYRMFMRKKDSVYTTDVPHYHDAYPPQNLIKDG